MKSLYQAGVTVCNKRGFMGECDPEVLSSSHRDYPGPETNEDGMKHILSAQSSDKDVCIGSHCLILTSVKG